jgi:hypothetical protein
MKPILPVLVALTIAGCASPEPKSAAQLPAELEVDSKAVVSQYECKHAIAARGAKAAAWEDAVCIRMKDRMVFGRYDRGSKRYVQSALVPFSTVKTAKQFPKSPREIQLETDSGVHTFFAKKSGLMFINDNEKTDQEFAAFSGAGLRTAEASYSIRNSQSSSFVPIFIPSR